MNILELKAALENDFPEKIMDLINAKQEITLVIDKKHLVSVMQALRDQTHYRFDLLLDVCGVDYLHYGCDEWQTQSTTQTGFSRGTIKMNPLKKNKRPNSTIELVEASGFLGEVERRTGAHTEIREDSSTAATTKAAASVEFYERFAVVYHLLSTELNHRLRIKVFLSESELTVPSVISIWQSANWFEREAFDLFGIIFTGHPDLRRILTDYGFVGHPFRKDFPLIGEVEVRYDAAQARVIYEKVTSVEPRTLEPKVIRDDARYLSEEGVS